MPHGPWAALPFTLSFLLPPLVILCLYERGWWTCAPVAIVFFGIPLLDRMAGVADRWRDSPEWAFNRWFRLVTWIWVPLQAGLLLWVLRTVQRQHLTGYELIGAALSMGAVSGAIGMTVAHELIHRRAAGERALGDILLALASYPHFAIEHVHGHHRHVATPRDPATARYGESLYGFLPRTLAGSLRSAWHLEVERLARRNHGPWSPINRMLRYVATMVVLYLAIRQVFGNEAVMVFAAQSLVAILVLETINYVEHYGLMRKRLPNGDYEKVQPYHSWDSAYRITNWLLLNLARHADHHCVAAKRYQSLELLPQAPRLPGGYGAMFLLALVPPLWFRVMNPRVEEAMKQARPA
jgi:alkane 1-monooxygenase